MQSPFTRIGFCVLAMVVATGCASTKVIGRERLVTEQLPRPGHIWVYDFAATPREVPAGSALAGQPTEHPTPQTAEQIATGRHVGDPLRGSWLRRSVVWDCRRSGVELLEAGDQRHCAPGLSPFDRRGQRDQTRRNRFRFRGIRVDDGGRRLPDDG